MEHQKQRKKKGDHTFPSDKVMDRIGGQCRLRYGWACGSWRVIAREAKDGDRDVIPKERFQYLRNDRNESIGIDVSRIDIIFQPYLEIDPVGTIASSWNSPSKEVMKLPT